MYNAALRTFTHPTNNKSDDDHDAVFFSARHYYRGADAFKYRFRFAHRTAPSSSLEESHLHLRITTKPRYDSVIFSDAHAILNSKKLIYFLPLLQLCLLTAPLLRYGNVVVVSLFVSKQDQIREGKGLGWILIMHMCPVSVRPSTLDGSTCIFYSFIFIPSLIHFVNLVIHSDTNCSWVACMHLHGFLCVDRILHLLHSLTAWFITVHEPLLLLLYINCYEWWWWWWCLRCNKEDMMMQKKWMRFLRSMHAKIKCLSSM